MEPKEIVNSALNSEPHYFFEDKETEDKFREEMRRRDDKRKTGYALFDDDYHIEMYQPVYEFVFEEYPNFKGVLVKLKK